MKISLVVRLLALFGLAGGAISSRADIGFQMEIWNGYNGDFYYPAVYLNNPSPAPVTYHRVESENGLLWRNVGTNNDGNAFFLTNDLSVVVNECTNGVWKLWLNKGHASEELYYFTVSISGVTPGVLGGVQVLYPANNSVNVPASATFHFTGPVNLPSLNVQAYNNAFPYFQAASLPSTATNWTPASPMPGGEEIDFYITYKSNDHAGFVFSTPTNTSSTLPGWDAQGNIGSYVFSSFTTAGSALGNAVDAPQLTWTTSGDADWSAQTAESHDAVDAARSGALDIGSLGYSSIETEVTGPCTVSFWWRNIVEDDWLYTEFYIDDEYTNSIYGQTSWSEDGPYQLGPGAHTLRWTTYDDGTEDPNAAGYLDQVTIAFPPPPGGGNGHTNVAYYTFENNSISAQDESGNNNHISGAGSFGGGTGYATNDTFAGGSYAGFFNGNGPSGGFSINPPTSVLGALSQSFSVSVWIKTTQVSGNDSDNGLSNVGLVAAFNGGPKWIVPMALTGSKLAFATGGSPNNTLHSSADINTGNYVHLVVTRDQATGVKKIYINGVPDASTTSTTGALDDPTDLNIGASNGHGFNGRMDEIQFYTGVLSATEVSFLYNNPGETVPNTTGGGSGGGSLGDAVDAPQLTWTTGGDATNWASQTNTTHDGVDAARSGPITIGNFESTYIETEVTGPCDVTFWWRNIDDDDSFYTQFHIDGGPLQNEIYGSTGWAPDGPYALGPGLHTLTWTAFDDGSTDPDAAAYLDQVTVTPVVYPEITRNPFSQTNRPGYQVALHAEGTNVTSWRWYKVGTGLIPGANNNLHILTNSGTAGVAGSYYAIASNSVASVNTTTAAVTFVSAALPPDWSLAFKTPLNSVSFSERRTNYGIAILADGLGNLYSANSYTGTNLFGSDTLISGPGRFGTALMKQTTAGVSLWVRGITNTGDGNSYPQCLAPAPGGGVFMSGVYLGTNGLGTNQLAGTADGTTYLARFDADGNILWVRTVAGTNANYHNYHQLASGPDGSVTISCLIQGTVTLGTTNITVTNQSGLLAQYDASGDLRWAQVPSGWVRYLAYSAGRLYGSLGGQPTNFIGGVTNDSDRTFALFSLNATNGQAHWLANIGSTNGAYTLADSPNVSVSGTNVFVIGRGAGGSASFGPHVVTWPDDVGLYFARYDTNGTAHTATAFGSPTTMPWVSMADASGNVYVGGDFDTYSQFGSNLVAGYHKAAIGTDSFSQAFVAKFDRNGSALWARTAQSSNQLVNLRDLALTSDGVWAYGFLLQHANFGSNLVYGTSFIISSELQHLMGGVFGKIADSVALPSPNPVTLLSPTNSGGNFAFSFQSQSPFIHAVQYRTNLVLGTWQTYSNVTGDGSLKNFSVPLSVFGDSKDGFVRVATQ